MKKYSILFVLILIASFVFAAQAQTNKASTIRDTDFRNFSYSTLFDGSGNPQTIKLADGKFEDGGSYDSGGTLYELFGAPVYGDLNCDKSDEAIVELKMSAPPSLRGFEVQAFTFSKGQTKMLARIDGARVLADYQKYFPKGTLHYAGTNPPTVKSGVVTIEALTDGSFACPKYTAVFNYKLSGGKFILSGKPTRKNFTCS
jgi:hypothetical protein